MTRNRQAIADLYRLLESRCDPDIERLVRIETDPILHRNFAETAFWLELESVNREYDSWRMRREPARRGQ